MYHGFPRTFPDEFEVLISQTIKKYPQSFDCSVGGIQEVKSTKYI